MLGPLPEPVATIGNDGHPRHIRHVWGAGETRLYGTPRGLYLADQMRAYAADQVAAELVRLLGGHDLEAMCEAFHRLIEAHAQKSPFHQPVVADAQIALRVLRGVVSGL